MTVVRGKKSGTLYKTIDAHCLIYVDAGSKTSNQWHQRLGHASEKEKLKRVSFQKSSITAKKDRLAAEASDLEQSRPVCAEVEGIPDSLMMAQTCMSSQVEELVRQSSAQRRKPDCYGKVCKIGDSSRWELEKMKSPTWKHVELSTKKKVHNKWMYMIKGLQQKAGIRYIDIFAPVVKEIKGKLKLCPTSIGLLE